MIKINLLLLFLVILLKLGSIAHHVDYREADTVVPKAIVGDVMFAMKSPEAEYKLYDLSDPYNVKEAGSVEHCVHFIAMEDDYLAFLCCSDSILIYNIEDIYNPYLDIVLKTSIHAYHSWISGKNYSLEIDGSYLYLNWMLEYEEWGETDACEEIWNISSHSNPVSVYHNVEYWGDGLIDSIIEDGLAYTINIWDESLKIFDVTEPLDWKEIGKAELPRDPEFFYKQGDTVLVYDKYDNLYTIDVSDAASPTIINAVNFPSGYNLFVCHNGHYYLYGSRMGFAILDTSDMGNISILAEFSLYENSTFMFFVDDYTAMVPCKDSNQFIDFSDPGCDFLWDKWNEYTMWQSYRCALQYPYFCVFEKGGFHVLNVSDPEEMYEKGLADFAAGNVSLKIEMAYAYCTGGSGITVCDIKKSGGVGFVSRFDMAGGITDISVYNRHLYAFCHSRINTFDLANILVPENLGCNSVPYGNYRSDVYQGHLFSWAGDIGITVFSIGEDYLPVEKNRISVDAVVEILFYGDYMYAVRNTDIQVYNICNVSNPVFVTAVEFDPIHNVTACAIEGNELYICDANWNRVQTFGLSDPSYPEMTNELYLDHPIYALFFVGNAAIMDNGYGLIQSLDRTAISTTFVPQIPTVDHFKQNYPNPFNPETHIEFSINKQAHTSLKIYNVKGQLVNTLVDCVLPEGDYNEIWRGVDSRNKPVSSGVYFYRIEAGGYQSTRKMLLMK